MIKHNQDGAVSGLAVSLVLTLILLIGALGFGFWAFSGRQDYKNNVDAKVKVAEENARQKESIAKDAQFAEQAKNPLKTYVGPADAGSVTVSYPKTWSAYVDDAGSGENATVNAFFAPGEVPSANNMNSVFALRVQTLNQPYAKVLESLTNSLNPGSTVTAYALPKLPNIVGVKVAGVKENKSTTMVVLPLRSQTLEAWTDGTQYLNDFNNSILPNLSFSP